ncbi:hypothetical protein HBA54_07800 [Pelagibius litoralis]|uniref:Uncharacterized protein n=1 Tax=Pelagibius litoralis TaxID=374515 RepID=A0A967EVV9_9PROT|nr:hypothetical protein [Pelagibius litoralis]NIA68494.1 hypothetical protein [Pelagibius litoralis]
MAAFSFSTSFSRRTMLAALPATALSPATHPARTLADGGDREVARLAADYRRAATALTGWIALAEGRDGPFAYEEPQYSARYEALCAHELRCAEALARARPAGMGGLLIKLRVAFHCDDLCAAMMDSDDTILRPALRDLERLAGEAAKACL